MKWPQNSPDLNPIENFWGILKQQLYDKGKKYKSKSDLWEAIVMICNKIDEKVINKLTASTNKRIFQLILNKGSYVDY